MRDKYDEAVEYLTARPSEIRYHWYDSKDLFQCVTLSGLPEGNCGCLTTIRNPNTKSMTEAWTPELTAAIRGDERIPLSPADITPENLPVFAEWQRKIDVLLNRN